MPLYYGSGWKKDKRLRLSVLITGQRVFLSVFEMLLC